MKVFLITFHLREIGQEYELLEQLKIRFDVWSRVSACSYAVETAMTPREVFDVFSPLLEEDDILYVLNLTRPFHGQGPVDVNEWLEDTLP
jgi:hypothetical protein